MFESRISSGATEKLPGWDKPRAKTSAWSWNMEGHARKCVERYCELANKKTEKLFTVSHPCLNDHQNTKEELGNKGELSDVCSHIVSKMPVLGTKWWTWLFVVSQQTGTFCHKMDSSMWQTIGTINFLHSFHKWLPPILSCGKCGPTLSVGSISRFSLCRRSWRLKNNIRRRFVHLGSRTFVQVSWMCKKQMSVSHNSTESEIISLDAGFRMDGLLALDVWNLVIEVLGTTHRIPKPTQACTREIGVEI